MKTKERELVATAKGFRLAYMLMARGSLSLEEIASELECTIDHARKVVIKCELAGPIVQDDKRRYRLMLDMADWL